MGVVKCVRRGQGRLAQLFIRNSVVVSNHTEGNKKGTSVISEQRRLIMGIQTATLTCVIFTLAGEGNLFSADSDQKYTYFSAI